MTLTETDAPTDELTGSANTSSVAAVRPGTTYAWNPRASLFLAAGLAAILLALTLLSASGADSVVPLPIRVILSTLGVLLLPGLPLVVALRIPGRALGSILIVTLSLSIFALAAQTTMVLEWWSPVRTQAIILVVSLVASAGAWLSITPDARTSAVGFHRTAWTRTRGLSLAGLVLAVALLVLAASRIDVMQTRNVGVIAQVGPFYVLGLTVLAAVVVTALRARRLDTLLLSATTVVVVAYNTMLVGLATGETSIPTAYVHRGFISAMAYAHVLPTQNDARFSWAGFFSVGAHLQTMTGLPDVDPLLLWAPLVFGVILAFGLYAIAIAITGRARVAWLAVIGYQAFNWYQQDYFAPQAMAIAGYTAILGTLLWQFRRAPLPPLPDGSSMTLWIRPHVDEGRLSVSRVTVSNRRLARIIATARRVPGRVPGFGAGRTLAIAGVLLIIIAANTVSHQMTPILTILALGAFCLAGATRYRVLWLAAGLIFAAWFSYGATDYWLGHLQSLINEVGQVGNSVESGVGNRLTGDPVYMRMQYLRMAASAGFALTAFVGWLLWRRKRCWWIGGLLCALPFFLVVVQSYGGEMIIRCFLLASPALAPFAALAVVTLVRRLRSWPRNLVVALLVIMAVAVGLLETTNRGLNTGFEASTRAEVMITDEFMAKLPPNSQVMTFSHAPHTIGIRRTFDPTGPQFGYIDSFPCLDDLANCTQDREPNYVYITNQGLKMIAYQFGRDPQQVQREIDQILASGDYVVDHDAQSVKILRRTSSPQLDLSASAAAAGEGSDR